jgi:competence protein ComEC
VVVRVLLWFAAAFCAGALGMVLGLETLIALIIAAAALVTAIPLLITRKPAAVPLLGLCVGLLWTMGYQYWTLRPTADLVDTTQEITGIATDYSTETTYGIKVRAKITCGGVTTTAQVWLYNEEALTPGDQFSVLADLQSPDSLSSYDYRADGVALLCYGKGQAEITQAAGTPLWALPKWLAHRLRLSLLSAMPEDTLGYGLALTIGDRSGLTSGEKEDLQISGSYHMLALSGMHLTVLVGFVALLIPKRRRRAWVGVPLCVLFALVTGAGASIVRAAVMECMVLLAPCLGREEDNPTSLGLAALALTAQNPYCLLDWGMQLSFASMAGLLLWSGKISQRLEPIWTRWKNALLKNLLRLTAASLAATWAGNVAAIPLMMVHFGRISLIAPVTNLLAGWAISLCFGGSLLTAILGIGSPSLGLGLGWLVSWPIRGVRLAVQLLARIPFAALDTGTAYGLGWVALAYGLIILVVRQPKKDRRWVIPACCLVTSLAVCLLLSMLQPSGLELTVLDVGQGQCLIFRSQGQTIMVDCGGSQSEAVGDQAAAALDAVGEDRVDVLILTHYDTDHVGGVVELLDRMTVAQLFLPDLTQDPETRATLEAAAQDIPITYVTEKTTVSLGSGQITIFPPDGVDGTNAGLSLLAQGEETSILVTGDLDQESEQRLLDRWSLPTVDILIAGHHGSKTSTSQALLAQTQPKIVVISVGKNSYGHPAQDTLDRIAAIGATIYRTDQCGTVKLKGA